MAKHRHRIFEIYEDREEAIGALTPKSVKPDDAKANGPLPSIFNHLTVSRWSFVTHVKFKGSMEFRQESEAELRDDFSQLADLLDIDSKVLLDFADVKSFSRRASTHWSFLIVGFGIEAAEPYYVALPLTPAQASTLHAESRPAMLDSIPQDTAIAWAIVAVCSIFVFFFLAKRPPFSSVLTAESEGPFRADRCSNCGNTLRW